MFNNPIYSFFASPPSFGPFFLRLAVSAIFFYQGMQKSFGWFGGSESTLISEWSSGFHFYHIFSTLVALIEILVSLSLFLGLFTRMAAIGVLFLMGRALIYEYGPDPEILQLPVLLIGAALALLFLGGGIFSIDRKIGKNLLPAVG